MFEYGHFSYKNKDEVLADARQFWNPQKTDFWQEAGVDLVIDKREGYCLYDMGGRRLIDMHLNGGTYNFGHRHPELVATLTGATEHFDIGNHWFPSVARSAAAKALISVSPGMKYVVFGSGGAEAVEIAIKSARFATGRRKILSIIKGYHGHSGLSVAAGDERFTKIFHSDLPDEFSNVPFNDLEAMERELKKQDYAALIMETIPATYGFPMPDDGYLAACRALCTKYGSMYIADEVQTGLMRTGKMWGWQTYGISPDIMVTAKGLSGGLYPISACLVNAQAGGWLEIDGAAHISTTGGSELGCVVAHKVLEMLQRPEVVSNIGYVQAFMANALAELAASCGDIIAGIRQKGLIIGIEFRHPQGAVYASKALYEHGIWAIFSSLDKTVLQWKPGVVLSIDECEEVMDRFQAAIPLLRKLIKSAPAGRIN